MALLCSSVVADVCVVVWVFCSSVVADVVLIVLLFVLLFSQQ